MSSGGQDEIDQLIARHKEALKKIEETKKLSYLFGGKQDGPKAPLMDRLKGHWQRHSGTWSLVFYNCVIMVLALRVASLRREFTEEREKLKQTCEDLGSENTRLRSRMEMAEKGWTALAKEARGYGWFKSGLVDKIDRIVYDLRQPEEEEKKEDPQGSKEKKKGFLI